MVYTLSQQRHATFRASSGSYCNRIKLSSGVVDLVGTNNYYYFFISLYKLISVYTTLLPCYVIVYLCSKIGLISGFVASLYFAYKTNGPEKDVLKIIIS